MTPDLPALVGFIRDHPEDDAPRLALADWLAENGRDEAERARGEFVRLQCRLARLRPDDPAVETLRLRERSLQETHQRSWLGDWAAWVVRPDAREHWFRRGLLRPWVTGTLWLDALPAESPAWDLVDGLQVLDPSVEDVIRLAASPVLGWLNALALGPDSWTGNAEIGDDGARALAASPHLGRLRSLELSDTAIGPTGVRALAATPGLGRLTSLQLLGFDCTTGNHIGDEGARAIAESEHLARLTHLGLPNNSITEAGKRLLAESPNLRRVTELWF